jgi:hypothetical protein
MLEHLVSHGVTDRLELVLVGRGVTAVGARTLVPSSGACWGGVVSSATPRADLDVL